MPKGKPLTPEQLKTASEAYARSGNYSEAARVIGCDESAIRRALPRFILPSRHDLSRQAIDTGINTGTNACQLVIDRIAKALTEDADKPFDPKELYFTVQALHRAMDGLGSVRLLDQKAELHAIERERQLDGLKDVLNRRDRCDESDHRHDTVMSILNGGKAG